MVVVHIVSSFGKQECEFFMVNTPSPEQVAKYAAGGERADAATEGLSQMQSAFESNAEEESVNNKPRSISTMRV